MVMSLASRYSRVSKLAGLSPKAATLARLRRISAEFIPFDHNMVTALRNSGLTDDEIEELEGDKEKAMRILTHRDEKRRGEEADKKNKKEEEKLKEFQTNPVLATEDISDKVSETASKVSAQEKEIIDSTKKLEARREVLKEGADKIYSKFVEDEKRRGRGDPESETDGESDAYYDSAFDALDGSITLLNSLIKGKNKLLEHVRAIQLLSVDDEEFAALSDDYDSSSAISEAISSLEDGKLTILDRISRLEDKLSDGAKDIIRINKDISALIHTMGLESSPSSSRKKLYKEQTEELVSELDKVESSIRVTRRSLNKDQDALKKLKKDHEVLSSDLDEYAAAKEESIPLDKPREDIPDVPTSTREIRKDNSLPTEMYRFFDRASQDMHRYITRSLYPRLPDYAESNSHIEDTLNKVVEKTEDMEKLLVPYRRNPRIRGAVRLLRSLYKTLAEPMLILLKEDSRTASYTEALRIAHSLGISGQHSLASDLLYQFPMHQSASLRLASLGDDINDLPGYVLEELKNWKYTRSRGREVGDKEKWLRSKFKAFKDYRKQMDAHRSEIRKTREQIQKDIEFMRKNYEFGPVDRYDAEKDKVSRAKFRRESLGQLHAALSDLKEQKKETSDLITLYNSVGDVVNEKIETANLTDINSQIYGVIRSLEHLQNTEPPSTDERTKSHAENSSLMVKKITPTLVRLLYEGLASVPKEDTKFFSGLLRLSSEIITEMRSLAAYAGKNNKKYPPLGSVILGYVKLFEGVNDALEKSIEEGPPKPEDEFYGERTGKEEKKS